MVAVGVLLWVMCVSVCGSWRRKPFVSSFGEFVRAVAGQIDEGAAGRKSCSRLGLKAVGREWNVGLFHSAL